MPSKIQVDQIAGATGSTVTLPSGQTLDLSSGTVNLPSSALSALNASNLTSGTVPSARLSLTSSDLPTVPTTKGGTGLTTIGTANQVLRVNSGATALEFGTVSSDFVKLVTASTSNTATLSVDGYFSSTYKNYFFQFRGRVNTNAEQISLIYRQNNADVTNSYYSASFQMSSASGTSGNNRANHDSMLVNSYDCNSNGTWGYAGNFYLFDPLSTTTYKYITFSETSRGSDDNLHHSVGGGYFQGNTNALSGFSFMSDQNGNITGEVTLYGIKN